MQVEKDPVTGTDTTGHEWDGIKELDTPVPWPSKWALWITILVSAIFWLLYPAFPYGSDFTRGLLGYNTRADVINQTAEGEKLREVQFASLAEGDLAELAQDPDIKARFQGSIQNLYTDNCAACHGQDLKGQTGFPDLTDGHWLWSGSAEEIELTIRHGINADDDDSRVTQMLAFGKDGILDHQAVEDVTDFVLSLSGQEHQEDKAALGAEIFAENCASCHGDDGRGGLEVGAPDLGDNVWIYGGDREAIKETIEYGREGVMPAWNTRLTDQQIRMLTLYVLWAGDDGSN